MSYLSLFSLFFLWMIRGQVVIGYGSFSPYKFNAAACCARGPQCYEKHARLSKYCEVGKWIYLQSQDCRTAACQYCSENQKRDMCKTFSILKYCFEQEPPYPKPPQEWRITKKPDTSTPTPSSTPASTPSNASGRPGIRDCSFSSKDRVINIAAKSFPINGLWKHTSQGSVIWRRNGGPSIFQPDINNTFCIWFKPNRNGLYYFTIVSSAPHGTEHNDAWFRFSQKTILYRPKDKSTKSVKPGVWMKGFQNQGDNTRADYILTIDKNGHQFFLNGVIKGKVYLICIAGRSAKFQVFNMVLIHCKNLDACKRSRRSIRKPIENLPPPTRCT